MLFTMSIVGAILAKSSKDRLAFARSVNRTRHTPNGRPPAGVKLWSGYNLICCTLVAQGMAAICFNTSSGTSESRLMKESESWPGATRP